MSDWVKKDICYLHIPKTGGNWVRNVLRNSGIKESKTNKINKHATYDFLVGSKVSEINIFRKHSMDNIRFFCVIRHPLLWYQSWFNYQSQWRMGWKQFGKVGSLNKKDWHSLSPLNNPSISDFNEFMKIVNNKTPGFLTYLFYSYTIPSNARVLKNELLRDQLLQLNQEWNMGLDKSEIQKSDKVNVSPKSQIIWSEENIKNTLNNESSLIKKYNYTNSPEDIVRIK